MVTDYSISRIETFENCPHRYKLAYVDRVEVEEETVEAFMGRHVHAALEKLYVDLQRSRLNTLEELLEHYRREWEREWHEGVVITREGYTRQNYIETGRRCIERYYARFHPFNQGTPIGIERSLTFRVGPHSFRGKIDRIDRMPDGSYEIHDYKASGHLPTQAQADADRQLALYQLGVQRTWKGVDSVRLVWHYLQFDTELVSTRSPEQLEALEEELVAIANRIECERDFRPRPSELCDWCPYWTHCPEKKHFVMIEEMEPSEAAGEEGFALVDRYARLKAMERKLGEEIAEVRGRLVKYASRSGISRVRGSASVASVNSRTVQALPSRSSEREEYDRVVGIVRSAGLWDDYSLLDTGGLLAAMGDGRLSESVARALAPFVRESERVDVRLSRLKNGEE